MRSSLVALIVAAAALWPTSTGAAPQKRNLLIEARGTVYAKGFGEIIVRGLRKSLRKVGCIRSYSQAEWQAMVALDPAHKRCDTTLCRNRVALRYVPDMRLIVACDSVNKKHILSVSLRKRGGPKAGVLREKDCGLSQAAKAAKELLGVGKTFKRRKLTSAEIGRVLARHRKRLANCYHNYEGEDQTVSEAYAVFKLKVGDYGRVYGADVKIRTKAGSVLMNHTDLEKCFLKVVRKMTFPRVGVQRVSFAASIGRLARL